MPQAVIVGAVGPLPAGIAGTSHSERTSPTAGEKPRLFTVMGRSARPIFFCKRSKTPAYGPEKENDHGLAIYHLEAKVITRGVGHTACSAAAYMSCSRIYNDYDGIQHDYTRKGGLVWEHIFLPSMAPIKWQDRETLWNAVEANKKTKDSHPEVTLTLLLPYHPYDRPTPTPLSFDNTFYPPGMETVPKRVAIVRANRYMVDHSDYLIAYAWHPASNARNLVEYARRHEMQGSMWITVLSRQGAHIGN